MTVNDTGKWQSMKHPDEPRDQQRDLNFGGYYAQIGPDARHMPGGWSWDILHFDGVDEQEVDASYANGEAAAKAAVADWERKNGHVDWHFAGEYERIRRLGEVAKRYSYPDSEGFEWLCLNNAHLISPTADGHIVCTDAELAFVMLFDVNQPVSEPVAKLLIDTPDLATATKPLTRTYRH